MKSNDGKRQRILKKIGSTAKSITIGILDLLLCSAENMLKASCDKKHAYKLAYGYVENEWTTERLFGFFNDLRRNGYIEIKAKGSQESVVLTDKARIALIEQISSRLETDGKFRYVSFDIPEPERTKRDGFRRAIKKMGFKQVQKSLWVTNKNVGDLVSLAAKKFKVEEYVAYIVSERSDIDKYIAELLAKKRVNEPKI